MAVISVTFPITGMKIDGKFFAQLEAFVDVRLLTRCRKKGGSSF